MLKDKSSIFPALFSGKFPISKSADGAYFIDRDPTYFPHILSYLREDGVKFIPDTTAAREDLLKEASFYQLSGLVPLLTSN